jgi:hypothetical protein
MPLPPKGNAVAGPKHKPGPGRPKGSKNRTSVELRQNVVEAYLKLGGVRGLVAWGKTERGEFYRLMVARLIPAESHVVSDSTVAIAEVALSDAQRVLAERAARALRPELVVDNTGADSERPRVVNE